MHSPYVQAHEYLDIILLVTMSETRKDVSNSELVL